MIVWRIAPIRYASSAYSGVGAATYPGRWNRRGARVAYSSDTPALAMLEILVHADTIVALEGRVLIPATVPDDAIYVVPEADLPRDWADDSIPLSTREFGDAWRLDGHFLGLSVPSTVMPYQRNILINPTHADFSRVEIHDAVPVRFDPRLATSH